MIQNKVEFWITLGHFLGSQFSVTALVIMYLRGFIVYVYFIFY